jgi:hypothetical protein
MKSTNPSKLLRTNRTVEAATRGLSHKRDGLFYFFIAVTLHDTFLAFALPDLALSSAGLHHNGAWHVRSREIGEIAGLNGSIERFSLTSLIPRLIGPCPCLSTANVPCGVRRNVLGSSYSHSRPIPVAALSPISFGL